MCTDRLRSQFINKNNIFTHFLQQVQSLEDYFKSILFWLKKKTSFSAGLLILLPIVFIMALSSKSDFSTSLESLYNRNNEEAIITERASFLRTKNLATNNNLQVFGKTHQSFSEVINVAGEQMVKNNFLNDTNPSFIINDYALVSFSSIQGTNFVLQNRQEIVNYIVQKGDTLTEIANKFNITLNTIIWANNLRTRNPIQPGQELIILPVSGVKHAVKRGDTISNIARRYNVNQDVILSFNNLEDNQGLVIDRKLIIPGGRLTTTAQAVIASGLKPMTADVSDWPSLPGFFIYPTVGGTNRGILHYFNATDIVNTCGTPVFAAAEGMVVDHQESGWNHGYGSLIKIQHFNGVITVYAHLSHVLAKTGDIVQQGDLIGRIGNTGNSSGCHLHFEVRGARNPFLNQ